MNEKNLWMMTNEKIVWSCVWQVDHISGQWTDIGHSVTACGHWYCLWNFTAFLLKIELNLLCITLCPTAPKGGVCMCSHIRNESPAAETSFVFVYSYNGFAHVHAYISIYLSIYLCVCACMYLYMNNIPKLAVYYSYINKHILYSFYGHSR